MMTAGARTIKLVLTAAAPADLAVETMAVVTAPVAGVVEAIRMEILRLV